MTINSRRRLRARLQRVATALAKKGPAPNPGPITPAVARELARNVFVCGDFVDRKCGNNGSLTAVEMNEASTFNADNDKIIELDAGGHAKPNKNRCMTSLSAFTEKRKLIESSMAGYKFADFRRDREMLFRWDRRQLAHLSKDEKSLYAVRYWCFAVSPEGLGRRRIDYLTKFQKERSPAEQAELDSLQALYPHVPWDDTTRTGRFVGALERAAPKKPKSTAFGRWRGRKRAKRAKGLKRLLELRTSVEVRRRLGVVLLTARTQPEPSFRCFR